MSQAPHRLAICITELSVGGAERCATQLALEFASIGWQVEVYSLLPAPSDERGEFVQRLREAEIPVHFLNARGTWQFPQIVWQLRRAFRRQRPDVVQTLLFHANVLGTLAARSANVPLVVTGLRVAEPTRRWRLRLEQSLAAKADWHVAVSQSVAEFYRGRLPGERISVIHNGLDWERFRDAEPIDLASLGIPPGRKIVTFVGRLEAQKNLVWLLEHARAWLDRMPHHDLLLVGSGSQAQSLQELAGQRGISARVHFAGWQREIPGILKASDVLLLPSAWEGLPNVVLEAMAVGIPVLATKVEGIQELLGNAAEPQMVPPGDAEVWTERLIGLVSAEIAKPIGEQNRSRVQESFTFSRMQQRYQQLYETLLGQETCEHTLGIGKGISKHSQDTPQQK